MKNIRNVKKISIIGGSGTGKSTLARNLGKDLTKFARILPPL